MSDNQFLEDLKAKRAEYVRLQENAQSGKIRVADTLPLDAFKGQSEAAAIQNAIDQIDFAIKLHAVDQKT